MSEISTIITQVKGALFYQNLSIKRVCQIPPNFGLKTFGVPCTGASYTWVIREKYFFHSLRNLGMKRVFSFQISLFRETNLDSPIHTISLTSTSFFYLPSLTIDNQVNATWYVRVFVMLSIEYNKTCFNFGVCSPSRKDLSCSTCFVVCAVWSLWLNIARPTLQLTLCWQVSLLGKNRRFTTNRIVRSSSFTLLFQNYVVKLTSNLPKSSYEFKSEELTFVANTSHHHFTFQFKPKVRAQYDRINQRQRAGFQRKLKLLFLKRCDSLRCRWNLWTKNFLKDRS